MKPLLPVASTVLACALTLPNAVAQSSDTIQLPDGQIPTLTITADPLRPSVFEHGRAASVLSRSTLVEQGTNTLAESISNQPGVSSTYASPASSRPVIRGNAGDRVRILKNGVGSLDISNTSEDHAVTIDPYTIEQVEILRGPETLLFGSSAIGGVVNTVDTAIAEQPLDKAITGDLDYRMGTGNDEISGGGRVAGATGPFNWHVSGFYRDTENIEIPGYAESNALRAAEAAEGESHVSQRGKLDNSFSVTRGGTVGASYTVDKGFLGASISTFNSRYGVPGHMHEHESEDEHESEHEHEHEDHATHESHAENEVEHDHEDLDEMHHHESGPDGVFITLEQNRADLRGELREISREIEALRFRGAIATYTHREIEDGEIATTFRNDAGEGRVELLHNEIGGVEGVLGLQAQIASFEAVGEEAFLPNIDTTSPAVFLFEQYALTDTVTLEAGARAEYTRYSPDADPTEEYVPLGASLGTTIDPDGTGAYTVGFSLAYTERAPSPSELFANGAHIARQIVEIGDSSIDEESSYGLDLSLKKNSGFVTGAINLYYQDYTNYINLSPVGEEEEGLPVYSYQEVDARFWGFEVGPTLHIHEVAGWTGHALDLTTQVDFVRARNTSRSEELPRIPPVKTRVQLAYSWDERFNADVEGIFVDRQDQLAPFELPTAAYQLVNAGMKYRWALTEESDVSVYVRGYNLTDEEARQHASFLKDLSPLPGRSVLFGATLSF